MQGMQFSIFTLLLFASLFNPLLVWLEHLKPLRLISPKIPKQHQEHLGITHNLRPINGITTVRTSNTMCLPTPLNVLPFLLFLPLSQ